MKTIQYCSTDDDMQRLYDLHRVGFLDHKDSVENVVPNLARDAETKVEVLVVVSKVVFLHLLSICWESRMVKAVGMVIKTRTLKHKTNLTHA